MSTFLFIFLSLGVSANNLQYTQIESQDQTGVQSLSYCRISTRDLINTAQDTVDRVLKGVCNPRDIDSRFKSLETNMIGQFNVLKTMVLNIEDKLRHQDQLITQQHKKINHEIVITSKKQLPASTNGSSNRAKLRKPQNGKSNIPKTIIEDPENFYIDSIDDYNDYDQETHVSPREEEITKFNSTIHQDNGVKMFTYYWKVLDIKYRMKNWSWRRSLRSQGFYVFQYGYKMYLRIYPNQEGKNIYVHVGLTKGEFDDNLSWPFKLKHNINVIDHREYPQDLSSRVWDPTQLCSEWNWRKPDTGDNFECVGLGFPQTILKSRGYIHDNAIIIKLTVYL